MVGGEANGSPGRARQSVRRNKYFAKKATQDGYRFDSLAEHKRYGELCLLVKARAISALEVHPAYSIDWSGEEDKHICTVILDFRYLDKDGRLHVEDVKGVSTAVSSLKRRLVEAARGIKVEIIK